MKTHDAQLRAREFEVVEKRQKLQDLQSMINDFHRMASDLEQQIETEHQRSGIRDVNHFAYPPFAKAARQRRDNLLASVEDLRTKLEGAKKDLEAAEEEAKRAAVNDPPIEERSSLGRRPNNRLRNRGNSSMGQARGA